MKIDMFNGMLPGHDCSPAIRPGDIDVEVLASGEWHHVQVTDYGMDANAGYWFAARNFMPKFWVADRGITWRRKFTG